MTLTDEVYELIVKRLFQMTNAEKMDASDIVHTAATLTDEVLDLCADFKKKENFHQGLDFS